MLQSTTALFCVDDIASAANQPFGNPNGDRPSKWKSGKKANKEGQKPGCGPYPINHLAKEKTAKLQDNCGENETYHQYASLHGPLPSDALPHQTLRSWPVQPSNRR